MRDGIAELAVPGGCWMEGVRYQDVAMRLPNGRDEAFVYETRQGGSLARRVTAFLARLVKRVGPVSRVTPDTIAGLTVGDREALLLQARRLMLGGPLHAVLRCPENSCSAPMDLDLDVGDLLTAPYPEAPAEYETCMGTPAGTYCVRFRLATGADQEAAAREPAPEQGASLILRRAVSSIRRDGLPVQELPAKVAEHVSARMAELDPQAELSLQCSCPACGGAFATVLDTAAYFFEELSARAQGLFRDVHLLALHYHWSEASVLSLPCESRRAYVHLLEDDLARGTAR